MDSYSWGKQGRVGKGNELGRGCGRDGGVTTMREWDRRVAGQREQAVLGPVSNTPDAGGRCATALLLVSRVQCRGGRSRTRRQT